MNDQLSIHTQPYLIGYIQETLGTASIALCCVCFENSIMGVPTDWRSSRISARLIHKRINQRYNGIRLSSPCYSMSRDKLNRGLHAVSRRYWVFKCSKLAFWNLAYTCKLYSSWRISSTDKSLRWRLDRICIDSNGFAYTHINHILAITPRTFHPHCVFFFSYITVGRPSLSDTLDLSPEAQFWLETGKSMLISERQINWYGIFGIGRQGHHQLNCKQVWGTRSKLWGWLWNMHAKDAQLYDNQSYSTTSQAKG